MIRKLFNFICIIFLFICSCDSLKGEYSLGNHLSLWDNDEEKSAIIVYCTGNCHGGMLILPSLERQHKKGEYVEEATYNKKWVIAKTIQKKDKIKNYYIISKDFDIMGLDCAKASCDSILLSHVIGPMNLTEFENKKKVLDIPLNFK